MNLKNMVAVAGLACALAVAPAFGATVNSVRECDVQQGFNYSPSSNHTFGYITQLRIGNTDVLPDIRITDPLSYGLIATTVGTTGTSTTPASRSVVAVLQLTDWSGRSDENILLSARFSTANAQMLNTLKAQLGSKTTVQIAFVVYDFDLVHQVYYTSFKTLLGTPTGFFTPHPGVPQDPTAIFGSIATTGLSVGMRPNYDVPAYVNNSVQLTLAPLPARTSQELVLQNSATIRLITPWGLPQR